MQTISVFVSVTGVYAHAHAARPIDVTQTFVVDVVVKLIHKNLKILEFARATLLRI